MRAKLSEALDECLARVEKGETVDACLARYLHLRPQLEPLVYTALSISTVPKASPSDYFRKLSKCRLMARLRERSVQTAKSCQAEAASSGPGVLWRGLAHIFNGPGKVAIPVTLALLIALVSSLSLYGIFGFVSPSPALASHCTLSTFNGDVQLQVPGSDTWEEAEDGMTLEAGSRVKTALDSQALLTFFNGTTIELEPGTDLMAEQMEGGDENQPTIIVLRQWLGKTWSRVAKLVDPGSHYEIQTPSACALVRGTLFVTEVDETGATRVQTIEGLVSVSAQDEEVYLSAGQQTVVEPGASPSEPMPVSSAESEGAPGQAQEEPFGEAVVTEPTTEREEPFQSTGQDPGSEGAPGQAQEGPPGQAQAAGEVQNYMWWVIGGVVLLAFGLAAFAWRRQ